MTEHWLVALCVKYSHDVKMFWECEAVSIWDALNQLEEHLGRRLTNDEWIDGTPV